MTTKFFWGSTRELTRKKQQQQQKLNRLNNHSKTGVETGKEKQQQQKKPWHRQDSPHCKYLCSMHIKRIILLQSKKIFS